MSEFLRFFAKSLLFFTAMIVAAYVAVTFRYFPPPPAEWAKLVSDASKLVGDAKETSNNFQSAASSAATAANHLAQTATALVQPVSQSLELARQLVGQFHPGMNPGGIGPGGIGPGGIGPGGIGFGGIGPGGFGFGGMGGGSLNSPIGLNAGPQPIQPLERAQPLNPGGILQRR